MIKAVLFDLFGDIAGDQTPEGHARLVDLAGVRSPAFWDRYWSLRPPYDRGEIDGIAYWHSMLGSWRTQKDVFEFIKADIKSWSVVDGEMVALVEHLAAARVSMALLSNIPQAHVALVLRGDT